MEFLEKAPVVVIGAGLAGLTAAWKIQQAGEDVVVLEATDQVGGRTLRSDEGWHAGQYADLGGELVDRSYHAVRSVCAELAVKLSAPQTYSAPETDDQSAMEGFLRVARFVVDGHLLTSDECARVTAELRVAATATVPAEHEIVEQWIRRAKLTPHAAGVTRSLARFFTQLDPWDCDVHFVFGPPGGTFQRVRGGTKELALALAQDLDIRLGASVVRIERGRSARVTLENGEQLAARSVVCAVGPFALPGLGFDPPLSDDKVIATTSLLPAMAGKVLVQYAEGDAVRDAFGSLVCTDGAIDSAWVSLTGPDRSGEPAIVTAFFLGADRGLMGNPDVAYAMVDELVENVIGRSVTRLHSEIKNWWADPLALGVTVAPPAGSRGPIAAVLSSVEMGTHFAGDYTDAPMSGTLEGAVRSGLRAAEEVLRTTTMFHTDYVTERLSRS